MLPCLLSVHYRVYDRVVNKECEIRIGGNCAFDDQFGVHEANVGEAVSTAICMLGTLLYWEDVARSFFSSFHSS
jgi:hypothetical protein